MFDNMYVYSDHQEGRIELMTPVRLSENVYTAFIILTKVFLVML